MDVIERWHPVETPDGWLVAWGSDPVDGPMYLTRFGAEKLAKELTARDYRGAVEALEECVRLSGADLSGGFPTSPDLPTYAVQCVRELREDYDAACRGQ